MQATFRFLSPINARRHRPMIFAMGKDGEMGIGNQRLSCNLLFFGLVDFGWEKMKIYAKVMGFRWGV
jgi:hypothetical protein